MPNELATTQKKDIRSTLDGMRDQFKMALPKLLTPERFTRVALTCINKNPKLLQCTRESLLACLMDCAMLGIEPDGRRAHLIPYGDKCTLIVDYKGLAELVRRSGEVSTLHAGMVYEGDEFDYMFGTGQFLKHKPNVHGERGKPICVYSYIRLKDGQEDFDVMPMADVDRIRKRSRAGDNGPWVTDYEEMSKKTVFRRHSKWLPLSPELREKIEKDDEPLTEQERFAAARPVPSKDIQFGDALPTAGETSGADAAVREDAGAVESLHSSASETLFGADDTATAAPMMKSVKPMPPKATKLEGLRNLVSGHKFEEGSFLDLAREKNVITTKQTSLDKLPEQTLQLLIDKFVEIVGA